MRPALLALLLAPAIATAAPVDHAPWDALVKSHVKDGRVDYDGFTRDRAKLDAYLAAIAAAAPEQDLAFWLNAYNATVVRSVLDAGKPAKVTDVKGFFDGRKHQVAGAARTLNDIENTVIRPRFKDARVHFALNCAAKSCPPLAGAAFSAATVGATLDRLTRAFLDGGGVRVDAAGKRVVVSKLLEWYRDDFVAAGGSVEGFLRKWVTEPGRKQAIEAGWTIAFGEYDWSLNKR